MGIYYLQLGSFIFCCFTIDDRERISYGSNGSRRNSLRWPCVSRRLVFVSTLILAFYNMKPSLFQDCISVLINDGKVREFHVYFLGTENHRWSHSFLISDYQFFVVYNSILFLYIFKLLLACKKSVIPVSAKHLFSL